MKTAIRMPLLVVVLIITFFVNSTMADEMEEPATANTPPPPQQRWLPNEPMPQEFDWVMLVSGEWLKGKLNTLYGDVVDFSSDKLGDLLLDWDNVAVVKTFGPKEVLFRDQSVVSGKLWVKQAEAVVIVDDERVQRPRENLISIVDRGLDLVNKWYGGINFAADIKQGNLSQRDFAIIFNAQRRSSKLRYQVGFIGRYGVLEDETTENTRRLTTAMDWYFSRRWFLRPLQFEYFSDLLQGIDARYTYSAAVGYNIIDRTNLAWEAHIGPGYQITKFDQDELPAGAKHREETSVGSLGTSFFWDVAANIDIDGRYDLQLVSEEAGSMAHHGEVGVIISFLKNFNLNVRYMLDRINEPVATADIEQPEKQDSRLMVGVGYTF